MPVVFLRQLNNTTRLEVTWNNQALADLERSYQGAVVRTLMRRGGKVRDAARRQIRFGHVGVGGRAAKGGRLNLRDTVHVRLTHGSSYTGFNQETRNDLPEVIVGSEDPIALLHHEGTRPHVIVPRRVSHLVFYAPKLGRVIYTKRVQHPGTRPNRYLTDNLHLAGGD